MINLHTRATCDECGNAPAVVQVDDVFFLCASCEAIIVDSVNSPAPRRAPGILGPSLATGMSRDPANAGGKDDAVLTAPSNEHDQICIERESGTSPGAFGTVRAENGAANSHCEPEQLEITGVRMGELASQPARRPTQLAPFDRNSNPVLSSHLPLTTGSETSAARSEKEASSLSLSPDPGPRGLDFEAEVSALEAEWLREGVILSDVKNSMTFRVTQDSLSHAPSSSDISSL